MHTSLSEQELISGGRWAATRTFILPSVVSHNSDGRMSTSRLGGSSSGLNLAEEAKGDDVIGSNAPPGGFTPGYPLGITVKAVDIG